MHTMKFGLVPAWFKHEDSKSTFNAQAEKLVETGGLWETMKRQKRCIVVAQGFVVWFTFFMSPTTESTGPATMNGRRRVRKTVSRTLSNIMMGSSCCLLGFTTVQPLKVDPVLDKKFTTKAALGSKQPLWSFTIVTTPASKDFEWLHDRQPVIIVSKDDITKWLDPDTDKWTKELSQLVQPSKARPMLQWCVKRFLTLFAVHDTNSYPVTPDVGKVGNESPTFIEPISKRKDGIEAMFASQGSQKSKSSPVKRKRSASPPPAKKAKMANKKEESDSDIELVGYGKSTPKVRGSRSMIWR